MKRLLLTLLLAVPASAFAEVKDATPAGFTVENVEVVEATPAQAWSALTGQVDDWWLPDHRWWGAEGRLSIDARAGGCFCERAGVREAQHLQVVFVDAPTTLRMSGGLGPLQGMGLDGVLEFAIAEVDGRTRITMRYRAGGYTPDDMTRLAPVVDSVLAQQLKSLAAHIDHAAR